MVKKILKISYIVLALAFIYAPIILLTIYSFNLSPSIGIWSKEWGFGLYKQLFTDKDIMQTVLNTVVLAVLASVCSTILGTIGAIGTFYSGKKVKGTLNALTQIPVINAEIVTAISIALVCSMFAFGRTYASLLIGHIVLCFPFVYLSVLPKLKQLDGNLYEAALDLGATPFRALQQVVIPQILPGIVSGFGLAITLSLDDYFIATYTKPAMFDTISTYVVNATKGSQNTIKTALWALSTVIFVIVILVVLIGNYRAAQEEKRKEAAHV